MKKLLISILVLSFLPFMGWAQSHVIEDTNYKGYAAEKKNKYAVAERPTSLKKYETESALITRSMKVMFPQQEQFLIEPATIDQDKDEQGYKTSFNREGHDYISFFDEDGNWIQTRVTCIDRNELPKKVKGQLSEMSIDESSVANVDYIQTHKNQYYEVTKGMTGEEPEGTYYYDEDGVYYYYDEEFGEERKGEEIIITDTGKQKDEKTINRKIRIG